ncbi:MAG TPA: methionine biosynthesis protein MetW [Burkholderiales bacterium]|nr:methionine biosynthesis protein MetW [Burkholderiales bacterium]
MPPALMSNGNGFKRADFDAIAASIRQGSSVLDLGCGDGVLLKYLKGARGVTGYGVEIDDANVLGCVTNGVDVIQSDLERGLSEFESGSFDYVVLSQTLQAMMNGERIINDMLRVGREGIVTFPNFGYWMNRLQVLAGRMPVSDNLPFEWHNTPNVHLCTITDFEDFCAGHGVKILERKVLTGGRAVTVLPNLLGALAVYRFQRA